jgi:hypothetical protein
MFDVIVEAARQMNRPTTGPFAESLWHACSGLHGLNVQQAKQLMIECGYVPFKGFPLTRKESQHEAA